MKTNIDMETYYAYEYQVKRRIICIIVGFAIGFAIAIGLMINGNGTWRSINELFVTTVYLGPVFSIVASIFIIREGRFCLYDVFASGAKSLFTAFMGAISGSMVLMVFAIIPMCIAFFVGTALLAVYAVIFPFATVYYFVRYFMAKKALEEPAGAEETDTTVEIPFGEIQAEQA